MQKYIQIKHRNQKSGISDMKLYILDENVVKFQNVGRIFRKFAT